MTQSPTVAALDGRLADTDDGSPASSRLGRLDAIYCELGIDDASFSSSIEGTDGQHWVLHVDDDREFTNVVRQRLAPLGISVVSVYDGRSGIRKAFSRDASAIILDYEMPNGQGDFVLGRLKENSITRDIPVIVLTGKKDRFLERRLLGMGASLFLNKPPQFDRLIAELKRHVDCEEGCPETTETPDVNKFEGKTILIADDDRDLLRILGSRCEQLGLQVFAVEDALTALSTADFVVPDLICLDVEMPNGNGLATCEMIACDERFSETPVIILTGRKDESTIRRCHEMCAYYVVKGGDVWSRVETLLNELIEPLPTHVS